VAEVALAEELLERERVWQQAELVQALSGLLDLVRDLVAVPELRLEVGAELVVDHEAGSRDREQLLDDPALIESAVRRVQTEGQADDFVADYAIIDDVPVPTLDECKRALVTKVRIMEETAMASIISPARERLMGIDVNAIYAKPETERSDADRALLAKAADIAARRAALQRHSANLEVAVEELTESAIDGWMPAPFPS